MSDTPRRHGRPLFALVAAAGCEWLAYWALRSQLPLLLVDPLGSHEAAGNVFGLFALASSASSLLAGIAVDLGGARRMAIAGAALLAAGLLAVALPAVAALYAGLVLVVAGKSLVQLGVLALVADLYAPVDHRRDAGFTLLWFGINLGAAAGSFGAGMLMAVASEASLVASAAIALAGGLALAYRRPASEQRAPDGRWPAARAIATFAVLLATVTAISLVMDTASFISAVWRDGPPVLVDPGTRQFVAITGFVVAVMLMPLFAAWWWLRLGERQPSSPAKILIGAGLAAAGIVALLALPLDGDPGVASYLWPHTRGIIAEILVAPIALSLVSRIAPPRLRGTAMGLWTSASFFAAANALPPLQDMMLVAGPDSADMILPAIAVVAGTVGYALLLLLGLARK
jgi:POT family proton-dependent oligopeptide transporter